MHRDLRKRSLVIALFVSILVALTACGDADPEPEDGSSQSEPTAVAAQPTMTQATENVETPAATPVDVEPTATESMTGASEPTTSPDATSTPEPVIDEPTAVPTEEPEPETAEDPLPEPENPAPELAASGDWYNSDPLTLAELRGSPVLLVFWATY